MEEGCRQQEYRFQGIDFAPLLNAIVLEGRPNEGTVSYFFCSELVESFLLGLGLLAQRERNSPPIYQSAKHFFWQLFVAQNRAGERTGL